MTYRIPSGKITLGLKILYYYKGGPVKSAGDALNTSIKFLFSAEAREKLDSYMDHYEIWVINPKEKLDYLEGIQLNALKGKTYHINCNIKEGKAFIWIEDESGKIVSEVTRGVGYKHSRYWLWENLPEPTY